VNEENESFSVRLSQDRDYSGPLKLITLSGLNFAHAAFVQVFPVKKMTFFSF